MLGHAHSRPLREDGSGKGSKSKTEDLPPRHAKPPTSSFKSDHVHSALAHASRKDRLNHAVKEEWRHDPDAPKRDQHDRHPNTRDKRLKMRKFGVKGKKASGTGSKFVWGDPLKSQLDASELPAEVLAGANDPNDPNYVSPEERQQMQAEAEEEEQYEEEEGEGDWEGDYEDEEGYIMTAAQQKPAEVKDTAIQSRLQTNQSPMPISQPPSPSAMVDAQPSSLTADAAQQQCNKEQRPGGSCML
jgi:hypothetical protein